MSSRHCYRIYIIFHYNLLAFSIFPPTYIMPWKTFSFSLIILDIISFVKSFFYFFPDVFPGFSRRSIVLYHSVCNPLFHTVYKPCSWHESLCSAWHPSPGLLQTESFCFCGPNISKFMRFEDFYYLQSESLYFSQADGPYFPQAKSLYFSQAESLYFSQAEDLHFVYSENRLLLRQ